MALHTEDPLRRPRILQVLNFFFAIPTFEAVRTERLVPCKDSQILNLVGAHTTAVGTIVADEGAIAEKEEVRVRVEYRAAGVASKAVDMPSISRCKRVSLSS